MKKAVVFIGAGASIDFGVPSTEDVYTHIKKSFEKDECSGENFAIEILDAIEETLQTYYKNKRSINFESIFHVLTELGSHKFLTDDKTLDNFRPIDKSYKKLEDRFHKYTYEHIYFVERKYIEFVNKLFIEKSISFSQNKNKKYLKSFIESLITNFETKIFSLNYDTLPLQCNEKFYTGFTECGEFDKNIHIKHIGRNTFFQLHGSVGYKFNGIDKITWKNIATNGVFSSHFTNRQDGASLNRYNIVTGYDKTNRLQKQPFRTMANILESELYSSNTVFIIGYGFGDLHINSVLKDYINDKQVFFVDYCDYLLNFSKEHMKMYGRALTKFPLSQLNFFAETKLGRDISSMIAIDDRNIYNTFTDCLLEIGEEKYLWFGGFKCFIKKYNDILSKTSSVQYKITDKSNPQQIAEVNRSGKENYGR